MTELPAHCEAADRDRDNRTFVPCRSLATKVIQPEEGGPCLHFCDRHARDLAMEGDQVANLRPVPMTPPQPNRASAEPMDRNETIKTIRAALRRRSGKLWSVTGGRGTAWGWLTIDAPPAKRHGPGGDVERAELARLLGLESVHFQGVSIPASHDYWREYIDRAEGRQPAKCGTPYWD